MKRARIAVTGLGAVTPLGGNPEELWAALKAGRDGVSDITLFDTRGFNTKRGAQVRGAFLPAVPADGWLPRGSLLAAAACRMAWERAGLAASGVDAGRVGLCLGSAMGDLSALEEVDRIAARDGWEGVPPAMTRTAPYGRTVSDVAGLMGIGGPVAAVSAACASGNYSLSRGADLLATGAADVVLAGGAEALSRILLATFTRYGGQLDGVCRPFDRERRGAVLGEGAGVLVLERLDDAAARRAPVHAELLGCGLSADARHMTAPDPEGAGAALAMERALADAGIRPAEVDYVNAHGTGTPLNDKAETLAVKRVFGPAAAGMPVSSTKSMLGHAMGAASAVEAVACCLALAEGVVPPTIHYRNPDPECDLDCVPNRARVKRLEVVLSNAFGIGGSNCAILLGRPS